VFDDLEHADNAVSTAGREPPALQPPERYHVRAQRQRLHDIATALHPAVDDDARASAHRLHNLGQDVERAQLVVELSTAVVRHPDIVDAMLDGQLRVLGSLDTLQHEGETATRFDAVHGVPRQ